MCRSVINDLLNVDNMWQCIQNGLNFDTEIKNAETF